MRAMNANVFTDAYIYPEIKVKITQLGYPKHGKLLYDYVKILSNFPTSLPLKILQQFTLNHFGRFRFILYLSLILCIFYKYIKMGNGSENDLILCLY